MESIDILEQEHDTILRALDVLARVADDLESQREVRPQALTELVEFFQQFADAAHHAKEEHALFPALEAAGMPRDHGPVGVMLHEHETGRGLVRAMAAAAPSATSSEAERASYCQSARQFELLLRDHIDKENEVLFPMARNALAPDADDGLLANYRLQMLQTVPTDKYQQLIDTVDALEREFVR